MLALRWTPVAIKVRQLLEARKSAKMLPDSLSRTTLLQATILQHLSISMELFFSPMKTRC